MVRLHIYLNRSNIFCKEGKESVLTRPSVHNGLLILLPKDTGFSNSLSFSVLPLIGSGFFLKSYAWEAPVCTQNGFTRDKMNDRVYSVVKKTALSIQCQWKKIKLERDSFWCNTIPMKTVFCIWYINMRQINRWKSQKDVGKVGTKDCVYLYEYKTTCKWNQKEHHSSGK